MENSIPGLDEIYFSRLLWDFGISWGFLSSILIESPSGHQTLGKGVITFGLHSYLQGRAGQAINLLRSTRWSLSIDVRHDGIIHLGCFLSTSVTSFP